MRKVVLFIAMSVDGYIADANGGVSWLHGQGDDSNNIDTYSAFIENVDTVLMGWKTYHQIATELSPDEWVYQGMQSYVFTHRQEKSTDEIRFTDAEPADLLRRLKEEPGKNIWVCGGASLVQQLMQQDLIDEYYLTVIPTILGQGTPLFAKGDKERRLRLQRTQSYNGIVEMVYERVLSADE